MHRQSICWKVLSWSTKWSRLLSSAALALLQFYVGTVGHQGARNIFASLYVSFGEAFPVVSHYFLDEVYAVQTRRPNDRPDHIESHVVSA